MGKDEDRCFPWISIDEYVSTIWALFLALFQLCGRFDVWARSTVLSVQEMEHLRCSVPLQIEPSNEMWKGSVDTVQVLSRASGE